MDESASGLRVHLEEPIDLTPGTFINVYHDDAWMSAGLAHRIDQNGDVILGFGRLDSLIPLPTKTKRVPLYRRIIAPDTIFFVFAGVLMALVAVGVLGYTPPPPESPVDPSNRREYRDNAKPRAFATRADFIKPVKPPKRMLKVRTPKVYNRHAEQTTSGPGTVPFRPGQDPLAAKPGARAHPVRWFRCGELC